MRFQEKILSLFILTIPVLINTLSYIYVVINIKKYIDKSCNNDTYNKCVTLTLDMVFSTVIFVISFFATSFKVCGDDEDNIPVKYRLISALILTMVYLFPLILVATLDSYLPFIYVIIVCSMFIIWLVFRYFKKTDEFEENIPI